MVKTLEELPAVFGTREVLRVLPLSRNTLYSLLRTRRIPAKKLGRTWIFLREEFEEWLKDGRWN